MARGFDIFKKPDKPKEVPADAPKETYSWFGPPDTVERFRFAILKENGDEVSLQPGLVKFKRGLTCLRWDAPENGTSQLYIVMKTTATRIDLKRMKKG